MKAPEISTELFYKIGFGCFAIQTVTSIVNYIMGWNFMNLWSKFGSGAGIVFSIVLTLFFLHLWKNTLPQETQDPELEKVMEDFNKKDI